MSDMIIKYRAWDKLNNRMGLVTDIKWKSDLLSNDIVPNEILFFNLSREFQKDTICKPNFILMQFTGLYDHFDEEIYEGDIVKFGEHEYRGEISQIIFTRGSFHYKEGKYYDLQHVIDDSPFFKIIGNIYENPELLTAKGISDES